MTKYWPNTQLTLQTVVKNNGVLATPTVIAFRWKIGRDGQWNTETPTALSTGVYAVYPIPTFGGPMYWQWQVTLSGGGKVQEEGMTMIERSQFDTTGNGNAYDYGFGWGGYW